MNFHFQLFIWCSHSQHMSALGDGALWDLRRGRENVPHRAAHRLKLWKMSPSFLARLQKPFKVIFFVEKLQMKCMPQKRFHLSPNEAFSDSRR